MDQQIAAIRQRFEAELPNSQDRFHPIDIERVRTEEWQVKRYILDTDGDLEAAYKKLIKTLEWKAKWNVHENLISKYPIEVLDLYATEVFTGDREANRPVICELMRTQRQYSELETLSRDFVIAWSEYLDRLAGEQGITLFSDFTGSSFLRVNLGLTKFRFHIQPRYYPGLARRIILHNVPKACVPPLKFAFTFFHKSLRENVVYTSGSEGHFAYIDPALLHTDYGGQRTERYYPVEQKLLPSIWTCYQEFGLTRKFVETFLKEAGYSKQELVSAEELALESAAANANGNGVGV